MLELWDGTKKSWQASFTHTGLHTTHTKWLVHSSSTFRVRMSHGQHGHTRFTMVRTWGKPPPSPPYSILYDWPWSLHPNDFSFPRLPNGSPEIASIGTSATLEPHNFASRPRIEMRSKEVVVLVESFPTVCRMPSVAKQIGLIFNFLWLRVKLVVWLSTLFLAITCVSNVQMSNAGPF
jgi:hypothetical protein